MTQVRAALFATDLVAYHSVAGITTYEQSVGLFRLKEARPTGTGIEFCRRVEQRAAAAHATVCPGIVAIPVQTGEWRFRPALARHPELFGGELLAPFGSGFFAWLIQGL
jgi:hypothetical protein